ncbi:hypothetical protein OH77DRAFT_1025612 [Trametes cingulata]|nr:hypothetical protein OH77DRAFT_1025612 [Trametes cingulata]
MIAPVAVVSGSPSQPPRRAHIVSLSGSPLRVRRCDKGTRMTASSSPCTCESRTTDRHDHEARCSMSLISWGMEGVQIEAERSDRCATEAPSPPDAYVNANTLGARRHVFAPHAYAHRRVDGIRKRGSPRRRPLYLDPRELNVRRHILDV